MKVFFMKHRFLTVTIPVIALIVGLFYFTASFIEPSPKKEITIATGSKTGNYYKTALQYKALLEKDGVKVNILESAGSIENIKLLENKKADIAFMQNGITLKKNKDIESLASIYYEPLWVFYKSNHFTMQYIMELTGKKIAIGSKGSGTKDLSLKVLKDNGIDNTNSELLELNSQEAKERLISGEIDAMFLVTSHNSSMIKELLQAPLINSFDIKRAKAYSRKYDFLEALNLYEGTLDLYKNIPSENLNVLATTATLISREDVSEELIRLFLKKVKEVHEGKGLFSKPNQFPNTFNLQFEVNEEAQRYFQYGDTFLEKIFPYWIASNIDRLKILLIPLITLLLPLFKGFFPLYNWSMRSKIYRWYDEIKEIDEAISVLNKSKKKEQLETLEKLREEISAETKVPLSFMGEYYNLQLHLNHVKDRLEKS